MSDWNNSQPEYRFTKFPPMARRLGGWEDGPRTIYGYAAAFGKISRKLGGWVEQVDPTAFNGCHAEHWPDVTADFDRDNRLLLGTSYSHTLKLTIDETGLAYEVEPPKALDYITEYVGRGDIRHSYFAFRVGSDGGDEWGLNEFGYPLRTLRRVTLVSVGPVLPLAGRHRAEDWYGVSAVESLARAVHVEPDEVAERMKAGTVAEFFKRTDGGAG